MDNKKIIGQRINSALSLRDKKQKDLANALGVTDNTISYFCCGSRTPNTAQIIEIAKFLNVSTDYLLGFPVEPTNDMNLQAVCKYTGLSEEAVDLLQVLSELKQVESDSADCESVDDEPYDIDVISKIIEGLDIYPDIIPFICKAATIDEREKHEADDLQRPQNGEFLFGDDYKQYLITRIEKSLNSLIEKTISRFSSCDKRVVFQIAEAMKSGGSFGTYKTVSKIQIKVLKEALNNGDNNNPQE